MYKAIIFALFISSAFCEPPVSGGYGGGGGGAGSSYDSGDEGQIPGSIVDQALIDRITDILNQQENQGGYSAPQSSYGAPSSSYGAPSSGYGAPSGGRIQLGKVDRGILVANFVEQGQQQGGYGGGQQSGGYGRR